MNKEIFAGYPTTRRSFLGCAVTLAACAIVPRDVLGAEATSAAAKPNSVFNGVRMVITYSYRGGINSAEDTLKALIKGGLSEVELMGGPIRRMRASGVEVLARAVVRSRQSQRMSSARRNWQSAWSCARCITMRE